MAIYINTNQNVQISYEISSIGDRLIAYLIDALVMAGISIAIVMLGSLLEWDIVLFLLFGVLFFYHLISEIFMNGQSVGKRSKGIKVMRRDGREASVSSYFLRFLLRPIDSFYGFGLAIIFFTNHNQRLGDLAAGTVVVNVKSEDHVKQQLTNEMNLNMQEGIKYPQVIQLSEEDVEIIKKILDSRAEAKGHKVVMELAEKIGQKLNIDYDKNWAYYFLLRIVQDYYKSQLQA